MKQIRVANNVGYVEVRWDDWRDISKKMESLKHRVIALRQQESPRETKASWKRKVLEACNDILNTDISCLYEDQELDQSNDFYVYAHVDPRKRIAVRKSPKTTFAATLGMQYFPFYIGKGKGDRSKIRDRNAYHGKIEKSLERSGSQHESCIIKDGLTESEALQLESKLIDIFGLIVVGGMLTNIDEGYKSEERKKLYKYESWKAIQPKLVQGLELKNLQGRDGTINPVK